MKISPLVSYQTQSQNNKRQNLNFGVFRFKMAFKSDEEYLNTLGRLSRILMYYDETATLFCGGYYLKLEYKIYQKLNKKGQELLDADLADEKKGLIKFISFDDILKLEKDTEYMSLEPSKAIKIIYETLSIGEDALKKLEVQIKEKTSPTYIFLTKIKSLPALFSKNKIS